MHRTTQSGQECCSRSVQQTRSAFVAAAAPYDAALDALPQYLVTAPAGTAETGEQAHIRRFRELLREQLALSWVLEALGQKSGRPSHERAGKREAPSRTRGLCSEWCGRGFGVSLGSWNMRTETIEVVLLDRACSSGHTASRLNRHPE
jgi:hypothetical protein